MVWNEKIRRLLESTESMELKLYRDQVRQDLRRELDPIHHDMLEQGRVPYQGDWLTPDEVMLDREQEKKEKITRLILVLLLYLLMLAASVSISWFVWRSAR